MISVCYSDNNAEQSAAVCAEKIKGSVLTHIETQYPDTTHILVDEEKISLCGNGMKIYGDFSRLIPRLKRNNLLGEQIVRAAKGAEQYPVVFDATAGLGEDSFLLAAAGHRVIMYEYNPIIFVLLENALERAKNNDILKSTAQRISVFHGDSIEAMSFHSFSADIILLDPMFPERKKSGNVKKKFQLLQDLEHPCDNEAVLLNAAIAFNPKKIIIKRPQKGPFLADKKPSYTINGKTVRYDCIVL